jgi:hypothetical protein
MLAQVSDSGKLVKAFTTVLFKMASGFIILATVAVYTQCFLHKVWAHGYDLGIKVRGIIRRDP